jgi:6-phosphogluconolactonase (cycloisomerase 2 family)
MKTRTSTLLGLALALALFPALVTAGTLRSAPAGFLTFIEAQFDEIGLNGATSVVVSPDGSHVYVAGQSDDAVAVFSRDAGTGALTFVETQQDDTGGVDGLDGATSVAVSPGGSHVYVAGYSDDAVVVFSRDGATGALTFVEMHQDGIGGVDGLDGATSVAVSPDGSHVYVTGWWDDAVVVFSRHGATGALTFVEVQQDGMGGVDGLDAASAVAVSPDGSHVYVAGYLDDAVAMFSRDAGTGALTFVEVQQDGMGGVDGLDGARSVALDPDGDYVYVTGSDDHAVAVFSRDRATGALIYVEMQQDGVGGVDGLSSARSVTVSPDGHHMYVAGCWDDAVAVFSRNADDGKLTYVETQWDGVSGVDGLDGAWSVAVSPNGNHIYVASFDDGAVAVFGRQFVIYLPLVVKS